MSIDNVGGARPAGNSGLTTEQSTRGNNLGKDEFLKLLVAQLQNQDPMSPQENGEFIAQLAQFSTVEGIQSLNKSMERILSNHQSSQALQASSLVGRKVVVPTNKAVVDTKETFKGSIDLPVSSANVWVNVYDADGKVVSRIDLDQQSAGNISFEWDGKDSSGEVVPPGTYRFEAQISVEGETYNLQTYLPANVDSVTLAQNGGEVVLNLAGVGSIPLSKVQIIGQ